MTDLRTVRGMRDLMGKEMLIKEYLLAMATEVFRQFGYEPLDSPVMELWETLSAKGGEEVEAETFKFKDKGDRDVGLRFDLTVPLARIVASNPHLPKPFKRYATGKAWRYDRPQLGRYREFGQADVDIIGAASPAADTEVILVALEYLRRVLGKDYLIRVNNRKILKGLIEKAGVPEELAYECFRVIDKLDKIGIDGVKKELKERGIDPKQSEFLLVGISIKGKGLETLARFRELLQDSESGDVGIRELEVMAEIFEQSNVKNLVEFDMSLARGLDYYTGPVFEIAYLGEPQVGSIGAGGRYDNLIEKFGGPATPATGISLGIDRLIDILMPREQIEDLEVSLDVYIAPIGEEMVKYASEIQNKLVREGLSCEVDLMGRPLKKLLDQADSKKSRFVVIVGPRDIEKGEVSLRDMNSKETRQIKLANVVEEVLKML